MKNNQLLKVFIIAAAWFTSQQVTAGDVVDTRLMTLDLASEIASAAIQECRQKGFQTSVVVVDRGGIVQVVMRDVYASRFNTELSERKANAAVLSGIDTSAFYNNRADIRMEMNEIDGILVLDGAVPIRAGGILLGAVGVSGAAGGDIDEDCAAAAVDSVQERLDFLD